MLLFRTVSHEQFVQSRAEGVITQRKDGESSTVWIEEAYKIEKAVV